MAWFVWEGLAKLLDHAVRTDIKPAPWHVVNADSKRRARLNGITHLLSMIDYKD